MIERTLSHEFDAIVKREFLPSGLRRSIDMPTTAEVIYVAPRKHSIDRAFDVAGCRVLVVEGETLIALLIEETLEAMECKIVGPAAKLEIALQLALDGEFDIAILDITVRGGSLPRVRTTSGARHSFCTSEQLRRLGASTTAHTLQLFKDTSIPA